MSAHQQLALEARGLSIAERQRLRTIIADAERRLSMIADLGEGATAFDRECNARARRYQHRVVCAATAALDGCEASMAELDDLLGVSEAAEAEKAEAYAYEVRTGREWLPHDARVAGRVA